MRKIVCAANKNIHTGYLVLGVRHFDMLMHETISQLSDSKGRDWTQGFVDNKGSFVTRKEAFIIATEANQIIKKTGGENSNELYSEDLY